MNTVIRRSDAAACLGALGALLSLWLPWYSIGPDAALAKVYVKAFGRVPRAGRSGWTMLDSGDLALCVGAIAVGLLALAAADVLGSVRLSDATTGWAIVAIAGAGVAFCLFHVVQRPFGDYAFHPEGGLFLALGSSAVAVAGGVLLVRE
ncbi:MAG TPA: hypothetical protein VGM33_16385 [Baekduia sp.]|jgi:hypothetical protein